MMVDDDDGWWKSKKTNKQESHGSLIGGLGGAQREALPHPKNDKNRYLQNYKQSNSYISFKIAWESL